MINAVLFDLDGTLADTAPDLGYALNMMRQTRRLPPVPASATRPVTSSGARGLLQVGFNVGPAHPDYRAMRAEFLEIYEEHICRESRLFSGIPELLDSLESRALPWGIVTNKAERLARLLLDRLNLTTRAACIIGGDSTPNLKPHPDPLFAACKSIGGVADACMYVGDDLRDIQAGQAAGMKTAAATWGYLNGQAPESWNANWLLTHPRDLLRVI